MILFPVVPFNVRLIEDPCNRLDCKKTLSDQDHSYGLDRIGNNQVTIVWKRDDFTPRIAQQDHGFAYQSHRQYRNKEFKMLKILVSSCLLGIPGMGLTTEWLRKAGITVFSENQIDELADFLCPLEK